MACASGRLQDKNTKHIKKAVYIKENKWFILFPNRVTGFSSLGLLHTQVFFSPGVYGWLQAAVTNLCGKIVFL